ncbi:hypothetical protein JCM21142_72884 [Saccharicrinis fermentans DSM 9555 = JCM 21142]|uniref:Uncharacterized protein n=1 Tax=Saccharicrinis fermentans DSM 9555 = JCM 21142 TaxID=869213 RepID=W7Y7F6_9BACT|nr:hypothetical protein JCM21142_72884 [Saccharicrinis fermentans DSM 9555 = JCM 21142]
MNNPHLNTQQSVNSLVLKISKALSLKLSYQRQKNSSFLAVIIYSLNLKTYARKT